jgi:hypothetical protein
MMLLRQTPLKKIEVVVAAEDMGSKFFDVAAAVGSFLESFSNDDINWKH